MKLCPKCQTQNEDSAKFCIQCGYGFSDKEEQASEPVSQVQPTQATRTQGSGGKNNKTPLIIGFVVLAVVVCAGLFFFLRPDDGEKTATSSSTTQTSSSNADATKYDKVIAEAKQLTIDGKFKDSQLKLASIPVSDLAKKEFSSVKEAVADLTEQNNKGIQEAKETQAEADKQKEQAPSTQSAGGFTGDYAKWANTFTFYYSQSGQKQSSLTITANGGVTQNNYDGTQFFGKATIAGSSGSILSYETNQLYPTEMPGTKSINPNVQITISWDTGGTQVYYGYLSYSSRLALTDGVSRGAGVNEVWISY